MIKSLLVICSVLAMMSCGQHGTQKSNPVEEKPAEEKPAKEACGYARISVPFEGSWTSKLNFKPKCMEALIISDVSKDPLHILIHLFDTNDKPYLSFQWIAEKKGETPELKKTYKNNFFDKGAVVKFGAHIGKEVELPGYEMKDILMGDVTMTFFKFAEKHGDIIEVEFNADYLDRASEKVITSAGSKIKVPLSYPYTAEELLGGR